MIGWDRSQSGSGTPPAPDRPGTSERSYVLAAASNGVALDIFAHAIFARVAARPVVARARLFPRGAGGVLHRHAVGPDFRAVLAAQRHSVLRADDRPAAGLVALHRRRVSG